MDPESPQQSAAQAAQPDTDTNTNAGRAASHDADLWRDPPPRPASKLDTPDDEAALKRDVDAWIDRNTDYARSWDSRGFCHLPLLSRVWGYDGLWFHRIMCTETVQYTRLVGRRLSPAELNLLGLHLSRGVVASSYDRPITLGATAFFLWRGAATFRMPFYQPRFVRFTHPQLAKRPLLSTMAWHSTRAGAYVALGYTVYRFLAGGYRSYIRTAFVNDCLAYELGMKTLCVDMAKNLERFDREQSKRRRLNGQGE